MRKNGRGMRVRIPLLKKYQGRNPFHGTLWTFIFEALHYPEKVRLCLRPDCKHYFIAQHGKELYCSVECANWSQAQLKKRWHEQQRQKRRNRETP